MTLAKIALLIPAALLCAAATPAEQVRDRVLAEMRSLPPATLAYDRTITLTQTDGTERATQLRIDRWDGKAWTLVSIDGKPPSASDLAKYRKAASAANVPGYYRLTMLTGATATTDAQGRTVLRLAKLPPGSVMTSGKDVTEHFTGEATVAAGPRPYVQQLRLTAREPFRMMLVARVDSFTTVTDYRLEGNTPRLVRQVAEIQGSMMGKDGTQRVETIFTYR